MIVGDTGEDLAIYSRTQCPAAQLITKESVGDITDGTYYLSMGDFAGYKEFADVLELAHKIVYCPPTRWSDADKHHVSKMQRWTEMLLMYFYDKKIVDNFVLPDLDTEAVLELLDQRRGESPQIWVSGGSDSMGFAIKPNERYGQLIADYFDMPVSFLCKGRASVRYCADQILRSDIRSGDLVILGDVPGTRFPYFLDNRMYEISIDSYTQNPRFYSMFPLDFLDSDDVNFYQPLVAFHQVSNFCSKIGARLVIAGIQNNHYSVYLLKHFKNYVNLSESLRHNPHADTVYQDFGTDRQHPGPLTHQFFAERLIDRIEKLYLISDEN